MQLKPASSPSRLRFARRRDGLDIAEIELSALGRQCISNHRIPDLPSLQSLLKPWAAARNAAQKAVDSQFTTDDARTRLKHLYPIIKIQDLQSIIGISITKSSQRCGVVGPQISVECFGLQPKFAVFLCCFVQLVLLQRRQYTEVPLQALVVVVNNIVFNHLN